MAFDKTGTLTEGRPALTDLVPVAGTAEPDLLRIAAALQAGSEHPLAVATRVRAAAIALPQVQGFRAFAGRGVAGMVEGQRILLGSVGLMRAEGVPVAALEGTAATLAGAGKTVSWLAADGQARGLLAFADQPRASAQGAVAALAALGIDTVMLTGDGAGAARAVAAALGIGEVGAEILPEGKAAAVADLRRRGRVVAMVGDGVNDAPALAAADLGIAMGTGTDIAMETAGITLMRGDPALVPDAIAIARRTTRTIRQGLFWAFIYNLVGIPLAACGLLSPVLAGAAMALSSVSVVGNALRLRGWKPDLAPGRRTAGLPGGKRIAGVPAEERSDRLAGGRTFSRLAGGAVNGPASPRCGASSV